MIGIESRPLLTIASQRGECSRCVCPHCGVLLSTKTFQRHKWLYYDPSTDQWVKKACHTPIRYLDGDINLDEVDFELQEESPPGSTATSPLPPIIGFDCEQNLRDDFEWIDSSCPLQVDNVSSEDHSFDSLMTANNLQTEDEENGKYI